MDFTAIDFETASQRKDSACQLAAVKVRSGEVIDSACWLIRPEPFFFLPSNIRIHGLTPQMVQDEPSFGQRWQEISEWLLGECLVAHNASFDIGVLRACLQSHQIPIPELSFGCTCAIARRAWPGHRSYGLKAMASFLGIQFRHHDALEDSRACAGILVAAAKKLSVSSMEQLESELRLRRGAAGDWGYRGPSPPRGARKYRYRSQQPVARTDSDTHSSKDSSERLDRDAAQMQRLLVRAQFIRPLEGRRVVFTGRLRGFSREDAIRLAQSLGGIPQSSVNQRTDLVVVGQIDERTRLAGRSISTKEETARRIQETGGSVEIVNENEFIGLVVSNPLEKG